MNVTNRIVYSMIKKTRRVLVDPFLQKEKDEFSIQ